MWLVVFFLPGEGGGSETCLSVFFFAGVWALGGCCRLWLVVFFFAGGGVSVRNLLVGVLFCRGLGVGWVLPFVSFPASLGNGSPCHLSCAVCCVDAPASCASGGCRSISCTIVRQPCAVHCAGAVRVVTSTGAWWTHASPRTYLGGAWPLSVSHKPTFWASLKLLFRTSEKLFIYYIWAQQFSQNFPAPRDAFHMSMKLRDESSSCYYCGNE